MLACGRTPGGGVAVVGRNQGEGEDRSAVGPLLGSGGQPGDGPRAPATLRGQGRWAKGTQAKVGRRDRRLPKHETRGFVIRQ